MSDGIRHHQVWRQGWKVALPLSLISYGVADLFSPDYFCIKYICTYGATIVSTGVLLGYGLGRWLDPDLDQMGITSSEGRMVNELPLFGLLLYAYWSLYGAFFRKKHRSFWTHFPGVSTAIRIFYQFWFIIPFIWINNWNTSVILLIFYGIFTGLSYADFLHWIEDIRSKEIRLSSRKRKLFT